MDYTAGNTTNMLYSKKYGKEKGCAEGTKHFLGLRVYQESWYALQMNLTATGYPTYRACAEPLV